MGGVNIILEHEDSCSVRDGPPQVVRPPHIQNMQDMRADEWVEYVTPEGLPYFHNATSGATVWELPTAEPVSHAGSEGGPYRARGEDGEPQDDDQAGANVLVVSDRLRDVARQRSRRAGAVVSDAKWARSQKSIAGQNYGRVSTVQGTDDGGSDAESASSDENWSAVRCVR